MFKCFVAKLSVCSVETIPVSVHYLAVCLGSQSNVSFFVVVFCYPFHEEECFVSINLENSTPLIEDYLDTLQGTKFLSTLDMASGYNHVEIAQ